MVKLSTIEAFLEPQRMAFSGVSRNPKKFGRVVYDTLKKKGFVLFPVHPEATSIDGDKCIQNLSSLPDDIKHLYIVTPKDQTNLVVKEAIDKGIKQIWIQQTAETPEAIEMAEKNGITVISKKCILMFAKPVTSVHKFHRFFSKLFGAYPKG